MKNTPGTRGGPGGRDRTLAVKEEKRPKICFFHKKIMLVMVFVLVMVLVMKLFLENGLVFQC